MSWSTINDYLVKKIEENWLFAAIHRGLKMPVEILMQALSPTMTEENYSNG